MTDKPMSGRITIVGDKAWKSRLKRADADIQKNVERAIERGLLMVEGTMKAKVSGQPSSQAQKRGLPLRGAGGVVLNKRSGDLFRSINRRLRRRGADSSGEVGTPIIYARTHEFGLRISYPKRGTSIKFPERPFVRPSLEEHRTEILNDIRNALRKAVR